MLFTAFSSQGLVMIEMLLSKWKFNSNSMCDTFLAKLNQNSRSHPEIRTRGKNFLAHGQCKTSSIKNCEEKMQAFYMGELPHSAYWQELSPKDLCGFIKEKLKGIVHNIPLELLRSIYEIVENIDKQTISYMD